MAWICYKPETTDCCSPAVQRTKSVRLIRRLWRAPLISLQQSWAHRRARLWCGQLIRCSASQPLCPDNKMGNTLLHYRQGSRQLPATFYRLFWFSDDLSSTVSNNTNRIIERRNQQIKLFFNKNSLITFPTPYVFVGVFTEMKMSWARLIVSVTSVEKNRFLPRHSLTSSSRPENKITNLVSK